MGLRLDNLDSMTGKRRALPLIAGVSLVVLIALVLGYPYLTYFDQGVMTLAQEHRSTAADGFVVTLTRLGDFRTQAVIAPALIALLLGLRQWRPAAFATAAILGAALGNTFIKWAVARARPGVLLEPLTSYSMPSGHSSGSFAIFIVLAVLAGGGQTARVRKTWLLLGCITPLSIALSRVYLGVHWPTDILAGAMLAFCTCASSLAFIQRKQALEAMPTRVWWIVLPALVAGYSFFALHGLSHAVMRYQY
jgi:membrane-associated phospholipid phosphatase